MTKLVANWSFPTAIRFGAGRNRGTAGCRRQGRHEEPALRDRSGSGEAACHRVHSETALRRQCRTWRLFRRQAKPGRNRTSTPVSRSTNRGGHDGVIAFGGGSALDLGKLIAFQAGQTLPIWDFEDIGDWWTRADADAIAPVIAVPTTAGTGSEVGRAGVLTNEATHTKKVIFHPKMLPVTVIADPELTVRHAALHHGWHRHGCARSLPGSLVRARLPSHGRGIAAEGVRLVLENLPKAYADGTDIEARAHMMSAAAMGATAFQRGLGAIHSLSHPIGALYDTHHGMTNAVFMPHVLEFNRSAIRDTDGKARGLLRHRGRVRPASWPISMSSAPS